MYLASLVFGFVKQNMMHIAGPKNWKRVALIRVSCGGENEGEREKGGTRGQQRTLWRKHPVRFEDSKASIAKGKFFHSL